MSTMDTTSKYTKYLWYSNNRNDLMKLFGVLKFYGISTKRIGPFLKSCAKNNKTDFEVMALLHAMIKKANSPPDENRGRGSQRGKDVRALLNDSKISKPKMYLDIGASDGLITKAIGAALELPKSHIHAVDVERWIGQENKVDGEAKDDIHFSFINMVDDKKPIIPYKDKSFDIITVLQALHHFENLGPMMKEIQRLSAVGGTVIIREHNADSDNTKMLTDLEHMFYGILSDGLSIDEFVNDYYGVYRSAEEWDSVFADHGFKCVHKKQKNNPTKYYYAVYVNVGLGVQDVREKA
jgi:ubiquinone/menaquinone biosynthesis C-methylase UbiE